MKSCLGTGAFSLALSLSLAIGCNSQPRINTAGSGGAVGSGRGGASGGAGTQGGGSDASTGVVIPDGSLGGGGNSGGFDAAGVDERLCGLENFMLERLPPDLLLVLDRSSSMNDSPTPLMPMPGVTLWTETMGALDQVVRETQMGVNWGLYMFPTGANCGVAAAPEAPVAPANAEKVVMTSRMLGPVPTGLTLGTPTSAAMNSATAYLRTVTTKNPKYIVLATDGRPTCPGFGADEAAVTAVTMAAAAGYKAYVIGIAINADAQLVLNNMAVAGGLPRNDPTNKYYPVTSRADLVTALKAITGQVSNCVFPLTKPPPVPNNVKVTVSGAKVNEDATNGWSYTAGNMAIQFNGTACEMVKTNAGSVQITFGCPNEIIP